MPQKDISEKKVGRIRQAIILLPDATRIKSLPELKIEWNQPGLLLKEEPVRHRNDRRYDWAGLLLVNARATI